MCSSHFLGNLLESVATRVGRLAHSTNRSLFTSLIRGFYAVRSIKDIPTDGAGPSSARYSGHVAELLNSIRAFLSDVCLTPMLGVDPSEFKSRLDALAKAGQASRDAAMRHSAALAEFYEWAVGAQHRVVCPRLREILLALSE